MTPTPSISLIIPTRNRAPELAMCLSLLLEQLPSDGSLDVHVCDDSDGVETAEMLAHGFPDAKRHAGSRTGPGANRNLGAREAMGEWLIFLDDDCLPSAHLVASYRTAIAKISGEQRVALAGATHRTGDGKHSLLWEAPHSPTGIEAPPSCNFAMRRSLFADVGGFDERFRTAFEDMEFFSRIARLGCEIVFVPDAAVEHPSRPIPSASKLANRWEPRVVSTFDFGASTAQVAFRLPIHIVLVVLSQFRGRRLSRETILAAWIFLTEIAIAFWRLPGWVLKYRRQPRSTFWIDQVQKKNAPPKFGL